jgi:hypothetical protein
VEGKSHIGVLSSPDGLFTAEDLPPDDLDMK